MACGTEMCDDVMRMGYRSCGLGRGEWSTTKGEGLMAEFLDQKRSEIDARLKEIKPLVDEYQRLEAAAAALADIEHASTSASRRRGAQHATAPSRRRRQSATPGGRGRPKGSGKRAAQALELVTESPGITIPELAAKMGIKQNYLYRVLPGLVEDGQVVKDGRGWHPKKAA
jgi:hypothetical protein